MIVIDSELIIGLYLPTDYSDLSEAVFRKDPYWLAPYVWRSELLSVVSMYLKRGIIAQPKANEVVDLAEVHMKNRDYRAVAYDVLQRASESGLQVRDCEYVSLAAFTSVKYVTMNEQVLAAYPEIAVEPGRFAQPSDPEEGSGPLI